MRTTWLQVCFVGVALATFSCLGGQSRAGKLQDSAQNLNQATRFGRVDIASELVAIKAQPEFIKRHLAWGRDVRLIDLEVQGMSFRDKDTAMVLIMVGWQRLDDQELRVTQLTQTWRYGHDGWRLEEEEHADGAVGLFGEQPEAERQVPRSDAHFRSVIIGNSSE